MKFIQTFFVMALSFLFLDGVWLGYVARGMYKKWIGHLMADVMVWGAAAIFYIFYIWGIYYFVVRLVETPHQAFINGALLGALCYGTYDLTNWVTLKSWPWQMVVVDVLWGMFITSICSLIGYFVFHA